MDGASRCALCLDIGFVYRTVDGRERVAPCRCRGSSERPRDPIAACHIPPHCRDYSLGNFVPRTPTLREAYERSLAYCQRFPRTGGDKGLGLLFWGPRGTGKTHLAVSVLAELVANKGVSGSFWDFARLHKEIGRCFDKTTQLAEMRESPLESTLTVDVLLLDDLASQRMPDWARDTLFEIINARFMAQRPTLITTAFEDVDVDAAVAAAESLRRDEFLIERIGRRVRSKLLEMCAFVPMQSPADGEKQRARPRPSTLKGLRGATDGSPASDRPPWNRQR